jgi:2-polyprenyl-6-hydroxyphenyl methylase/3-demethylubiquinone-9 3-methyltransferase
VIFESIAIAADHRGYRLKQGIIKHITITGYQVTDYGPDTDSVPVDYPDYAGFVSTHVREHPGSFGILVCNSGVGMAIAANKLHGIRAVFCDRLDIAKVSREHNDANIICFGSAFTTVERAMRYIKIFSTTAPLPEERYDNRIRKIDKMSGA